MTQNTTQKATSNVDIHAPVLVDEIKTQSGVIGSLTLNSEKTLNSITLEMVHILTNTLKSWADDDDVKVIILKSVGKKAFCAGGDIQALYKSATNPLNGICVEAEDFFFYEYQLNYLIHTYNKPIICFGDGIVMGGGLGLMAGASHRLVTETSRIAMPEITIGLFPDVGSTYFLNQLPYNLGYFFALTGAQMNAKDALFCHLADFAINSNQLDVLIEGIKEIQWSTDIESNHKLLSQYLNKQFYSQSKFPEGNIIHNLATLEETCRHNSLSKMVEAIQNFDKDNTWLSKAKHSLKNGSPLSALVIFEQLKRHQYTDLQTAFISEYTLISNLIQHPDFAEGVRALLIDKDKSPKWQYEDPTHIPSSIIESLFTERWKNHPLRQYFQSLT